MAEHEALKVFFCYAREDQEYRKNLDKHLKPLVRQKLIEVWGDFKIGPGTYWDIEIHNHLETADIILLLISCDFMSSDYCTARAKV